MLKEDGAPTLTKTLDVTATCLRCTVQVTEKKEHLAQLESLDMGKSIAEAEWDMVRWKNGG